MLAGGSPKIHSSTLPVILIAAVVQGWALYALHLSIQSTHWPATQPQWLLALYAVAAFVPLTVQLLAGHARTRPMWLITGSVALLFFYFAWHHGANVMDHSVENFAASDDWIVLAFVLGVLWLLMLPFIQCRLADGRWRARYDALFDTAWRNKLVLAEAVLFTGLFWLLLLLWQQLFKMLGIRFFTELFGEPIFIYPVTSLVFGVALHLIGSIERLTSVVLEQLLNVLKWLAILAGLILALFTVALIFKLPGMITSGERAISAAWLLWLVAVTVLLVNAAYRDGSVVRPYPKWIALALRFVIPLTIVIAITALYALYVRIDTYGFTVERVWASIVASAACIYAVGYALAARSKDRWMAGVAGVNVFTALFLVATISLTLTPVLSPYRITANSQFRLAQEPPREPSGGQSDDQGVHQRLYATPLHALRFDSGKYGTARLSELANLKNHPRAAEIREAASAMIAQQQRWERAIPENLKGRLSEIAVYPSGRAIDAMLLERLEADLKDPQLNWPRIDGARRLGGVFADLNADGVDEFILVVSPLACAYQLDAGQWRRVGMLTSSNAAHGDDVAAQIRSGSVRVQEPAWRELLIGQHAFRMNGPSAD